jgi:multiple sugar transport system permease protein
LPGTGQDKGAARLLKSLMDEGLGEAVPAARSLPRIKLVLPSGKAPVSVRKKAPGQAEAPLREQLPQIIQKISESAKPAAPAPLAEPAPRAEPAPAPAKPLPGPMTTRELRSSRLRRRYERVFGQAAPRRPAARPGAAQAGARPRAAAGLASGHAGRSPKSLLSPKALAWAMLLPGLLAFLLFAWMPMLRTMAMSFMQVGPTGSGFWVGLANYARALQDPIFLRTLGHAAYFLGLTLVLGFTLPLALALLLNEQPWGHSWLRLAFFLPFLTPLVPAVMVWRWIFDGGWGLANTLLAGFGLPALPWLSQPDLAMACVALVFIWKSTGWTALIYLTSLQSVPEELYETAEMEGAPWWRRISLVSLPHLRAPMAFLLLMQVVGSLQIFTEVYLLTGGGPALATDTVVTYLYRESFLYLDLGYASAMAVLLFALLAAFTVARLRRIEEEYE